MFLREICFKELTKKNSIRQRNSTLLIVTTDRVGDALQTTTSYLRQGLEQAKRVILRSTRILSPRIPDLEAPNPGRTQTRTRRRSSDNG